jgi:hypothetical protein
MKSNYEEKKQARIEGYRKQAAKNEKASGEQFNKASEMASIIPFGQPILIGHHSEEKDRRYRDRINQTMRKSVESAKKAEYYEDKASAAESNTSISSDDPNAIEKLKTKLQDLESLQSLMKAVNKIVRNRKLSDEDKINKMIALPMKEAYAKELLQPDCFNIIGFAAYRLQNNNQSMSRIRQRIKDLETIASKATTDETINGVQIINNTEENRVQIIFEGKPADEVRKDLKRHGFKWAPSRGAWQRNLCPNAEYWAKSIVQKHFS